MSRFVFALIVVVLPTGSSRAAILVDHQPHPYGGAAGDTLFTTPFGQPAWQLVADDFLLANADQAVSVFWRGFYDADNPPANELMRVRFYDSRPSDGLPGLVLYEETFQNPSRVNTGQRIQTGIGPYEYLYQATFSTPVKLRAETAYWLEVAQIGDITTHFRWEDSVVDNRSLAFMNDHVPSWTLSTGDVDFSFQLISPEPSALVALLFGLILVAWGRKSGRRAGEWN